MFGGYWIAIGFGIVAIVITITAVCIKDYNYLYLSAISGLIAILCVVFSVSAKYDSTKEYAKWYNKYCVISDIIDDANEKESKGDTESADELRSSIMASIVDLESWKDFVEERKEKFGIFSGYYFIDTSNLTLSNL